MKFFWIFLLTLGLSLSSAGLQADGPEVLPETVPTVQMPALSNLGAIYFFLTPPELLKEPVSVHVGEEDPISFCVRLNWQDPRIHRALHYLRGVEITLEGGEPSQKINGRTPFKNRAMEPDSLGCYSGSLKIPAGHTPGKYQVTELDLWLTNGRSLSLRDELDEFSPRGEVDLESPAIDTTPPVVEKFELKSPAEDRILYNGKRGRAEFRFRVVAHDAISGIDPKTFSVFFKVFVDGQLLDILKSQCKTPLTNLYYDCRLYFSRAAPHLRARTVWFIIDSISLADRVGNFLELNEPDELRKLFAGKLLRYTFYPTRPPGQKGPPEKEEPHDDLIAWPPGEKINGTNGNGGT